MELSRKMAVEIVTEIGNLIGQHVNMMDENGVIISSTDKKRVGTYHAAALRIISEKLDSLEIKDENEYEGSKKGVNYPVLLYGKIVGVIGITGDHQTVAKYGKIVKKMTEIFIEEKLRSEEKGLDYAIIKRFFDDWLSDRNTEYSSVIIDRGKHLGIDITLPRRVLAVSVSNNASRQDPLTWQRTMDKIGKSIGRIVKSIPNGIFIDKESFFVCLIPKCDNDAIALYAANIQKTVKSLYGHQSLIGIDKPCPVIGAAYEQATKAIKAARKSSSGIAFYENITFELFTDEISYATKMNFLNTVFKGNSMEEIEDWITILQIYLENNGSITKTSELLYIHKNTLQNKLNRLKETTGHDPRNFVDSALYVLAIHFYSDIKKDSNHF